MKRIKYYDLLRVVSFCFIIFYHMMMQLYLSGICSYEKIAPFFSNTNMHIATLAVAVFFMLSGASLAYTTKESISIKDFYKKRFARLLIPFYIVTVISFICKAIHAKSVFGVFSPGISKWKIIFTVLGMDEWVSMHGIVTFSQGIGEWFLGALLILYVLFPLLRFLMQKYKKIFFTAATCIYIFVIYNYSSQVPMHMSILIKGYEFILGMYLGMYFNKLDSRWMLITVPTVVFFFTNPTALGWNSALMITVFAVAFFVSFSYMEGILNKRNIKVFEMLGKYSYELFLVHHLVIYEITPLAVRYLNGKWSIVLLFVVQILIMIPYTLVVKFISDRMIKKLCLKAKIANNA